MALSQRVSFRPFRAQDLAGQGRPSDAAFGAAQPRRRAYSFAGRRPHHLRKVRLVPCVPFTVH